MRKMVNKDLTAGVISPAYIPDSERMQKGFAYLQNRQITVKKGKNLGKEYGYFAGTDNERLADLHDMYADDQVDLIICARGGWGGLRLLDKIDYQLIKNNPKPLIGYSDITTLQLAIWTKCAVPSLSGPMIGVEMGKGILPFTETHFWQQIFNTMNDYKFKIEPSETSVLVDGKAEGLLLGGCLSLVSHLLGTPYSPDYKGSILFLEDIGEKPYKIDRYLAHLQQAGIFDEINGLIIGNFIDCEEEEDERSFSLDEIFNFYFSSASFPVVINFPYGHGDKKFTMPVGVSVKLHTESAELILENPFQ